MKFKTPLHITHKTQIHDSVYIDTSDALNHRMRARCDISANTIILVEYPLVNLFGDEDINRTLQMVKKLIEYNESELYPRSLYDLSQLNIPDICLIFKDIKQIRKSVPELFQWYSNVSKCQIELYYAKYLLNLFDGFEYGPLYLPISAKLNHSCCNYNTIFKFDRQTGCMIFTTIRQIKKNEELLDSYLMNKSSEINKHHKQYLIDHYGFVCGCGK